MITVTLDCSKLTERQSAHEYLAACFGFPAYYGRNLDALADCLSEKPEMHIIFQNAALITPDSYPARVVRVFEAVGSFTIEYV